MRLSKGVDDQLCGLPGLLYADVVLPTAIWGEKSGTFTNADRTVDLSERAVDPPGEARSDLDIFLDSARRMDLRGRDGQPLIGRHDPEGAFEGRPDLQHRPRTSDASVSRQLLA